MIQTQPASKANRAPINAFKHKKLKLSVLRELVKKYPVLPLHNDMQTETLLALKNFGKTAHFTDSEASNWVTSQKPAVIERNYSLVEARAKIREDYTTLTVSYASLINELNTYKASDETLAPEIIERSYMSLLSSLRALGEW